MTFVGLAGMKAVLDTRIIVAAAQSLLFLTFDDKGVSMNPLDSICGTIITGLVLAIVLVFVIKALAGA